MSVPDPNLKTSTGFLAVLQTYAEIKGWKNCLTILVKDVLEIITVFSAKVHSMRSRKEERPRAEVRRKGMGSDVKLLKEKLSKLAELSHENSL